MVSLKSRIRDGEKLVGAFLVLPDDIVAETASRSGFDYIVVDCQHGTFGYDMMRRMIMAIELGSGSAIVRVPPSDDYAVGRALDAGAKGLIIPLVNNADEARQAVEASHYGPNGKRSFGPMRALMQQGLSCFEAGSDEIIILPQIETAEALGNLKEIVGVPGLDGVYVGPMDLAISLGLEPGLDNDSELFMKALENIVSECRAAGIAAAIHANADLCAKRFDQGFDVVTVATDISIVTDGFSQALQTALS